MNQEQYFTTSQSLTEDILIDSIKFLLSWKSLRIVSQEQMTAFLLIKIFHWDYEYASLLSAAVIYSAKVMILRYVSDIIGNLNQSNELNQKLSDSSK